MTSEPFFCARGPGANSPFLPPFSGEAHWRDDRTCSYCGSLDPALLFEQIDKGAELGPTDKSYKIDVELVDHQVRGAGKFYFQHLSREQMVQSIDLWNDRKLKIGFPGHFYVMPFFMQLRPPAAT